VNVSETLAAWWTRRRTLDGRSVGFVPTMGALHRGHSSLVERCRLENQVVVVSIFVNPSQFKDPSDLERYPRPIDQDLALLQSLGVDEVIIPACGNCIRTATASAWSHTGAI
jgi:pantoate--beta-alanine ligase